MVGEDDEESFVMCMAAVMAAVTWHGSEKLFVYTHFKGSEQIFWNYTAISSALLLLY
jgi:hypothetical protein